MSYIHFIMFNFAFSFELTLFEMNGKMRMVKNG